MSRPVFYAALFASLALNVFVGGAFVGAHLTKAKAPPSVDGVGPGRRNPILSALRELPPEAQATWRAQFLEHQRTYGPKGREARQLVRRTMRGFGAEPFDAQAATANLERARALEHESRVAMDRQLVEFAATLPQAERARFGEALAQPRLGGRGVRDRDHGALPDR